MNKTLKSYKKPLPEQPLFPKTSFSSDLAENNMSIMDHQLPISSLIHEIRGIKVMLDRDLAALYQVETKVLKQASGGISIVFQKILPSN